MTCPTRILLNKRHEMAAFDALGPLTRRVVSESPCLLDVRRISDAAGIPVDQLGLYDEELSTSIASMIEREYGIFALGVL